MKGYKITDNGKCRDQLYEVGQTYQINGKLIMCKNGFHFCKNPDDLFLYYFYKRNITKIFEVEVLGECINEKDKSVTDKLKIVREIPLNEYNGLFKNYKFNKIGSKLHFKTSYGYENWREFDDNGNLIHFKTSYGENYWKKYDENGNLIYYKHSNGLEEWCEYNNNNGNVIHFKNSNGENW